MAQPEPAPVSAGAHRAAFQATLPWPLDPFQMEAIEKLESHQGVLVAAPTSAGKTVIADYAIFRALQTDTRAIYTTPLKALSNQKFRDYRRRHGEGWVGLVTGENTINPAAPIVVMTTEVLRNLIYEDPHRLDRVQYVILDEIHYIDDFPRGAVWEEIIIQAPSHIKLIGLSATISNFQEVAGWMSEQRGDVATVVVHQRPVELKLWLALRNQFFPLLDGDGRPVRDTWARAQVDTVAEYRLARLRGTPENDLLAVVERLRDRDFVPAIYFIFSRRGCREALLRCGEHGLDLTTADEKARIDAFVDERLRQIPDDDEATLYRQTLSGDELARGLAMHHAGMLPYLKELIEELFQSGLIKVVFATETLSLGIHMPARAVVISSFTKFDGVNFASLTSGELTQLMGRAGRRGIDPLGHGVILKEPDVDIGTIYEAAVGEEMTVVSKFAPTYNMALNLLRYYPPAEVDQLMERSFGQYQRRNALGQLEERVAILRRRLQDLAPQPSPCCSGRTLAAYLHSREAIATLRGRLRRSDGQPARRGAGRGRRGRQRPPTGTESSEIRGELRSWVARRDQSPCGTCPHLAEHTAQHQEVRRLQVQVRSAEHESAESAGEYRRRMAALRAILTELGFLQDSTPTEKGLLASRIYGENSLIITQAIDDGWLTELTPAELAAALVMVTAEDRGRDRLRVRPHFPTTQLSLAYRRLRVLYFRLWGREKDHGEDTLRPLSTDYVGFTYHWASGIPLTDIEPPAGVDLGDAIKALKGLYSALRQIEWAVADRPALHELVKKSRAGLERDLITRV